MGRIGEDPAPDLVTGQLVLGGNSVGSVIGAEQWGSTDQSPACGSGQSVGAQGIGGELVSHAVCPVRIGKRQGAKMKRRAGHGPWPGKD